MYQKNIQAQVDAGVDGFIVGGSLGESSTLTHDERIELLHATQEITNDRIPSVVNIADGATKNTISLAKKAQNQGADGLMLLPPMMYKPTDHETAGIFALCSGS